MLCSRWARSCSVSSALARGDQTSAAQADAKTAKAAMGHKTRQFIGRRSRAIIHLGGKQVFPFKLLQKVEAVNPAVFIDMLDHGQIADKLLVGPREALLHDR